MDDSTDSETTDPTAGHRRPSWLTGRVVVLIVLLVAAGGFAGWRVVDRLDRPAAGDSHDVAYEGDDGCGFIWVSADGLRLRGSLDVSEPLVPSGEGTLVLGKVWDLDGSDGLGASGTLTLEDGSDVSVEGGTEGKVFFTVPCAVRSGE